MRRERDENLEKMMANPWLVPFRLGITGAVSAVSVMACIDLGFFNKGWCFLLFGVLFYLLGVGVAYYGRWQGQRKAEELLRRMQEGSFADRFVAYVEAGLLMR